jgi:hypothetical protein
MDSNQNGKLDGQEYPLTLDERLDQRRQEFFTSIVEKSANGRLNNQDSVPVTPRTRAAVTTPGHADELVSMTDFFKEKKQHERSPSVSTNGEIDKKVNGFERIKGMIRRRSAGLGLGIKVNDDVDLGNLSYIAEHQENLNVVQVMVHGDKMSTYPELFIEADSDLSEEATLLSKGAASHVRIRLPVPVQGGQKVPLAAPHFHLEAKLTAASTRLSEPVSSLNTMITQALCATDLRKIQPKVICCTGCDREIAELPNDCGFKDLPSEHWAEMMEVWMCHSDPGFTAQISAQTKDGFWPSEGIVLVGGSYLLLRDEYTKKHNLVTDSTSVSVPPYPVHNSPFLCIYPLLLQYLSLHLPRYPPRGLQEGRRHSLTGGLAPSLVPTVRSSSKFRSVFTGCRVRQGCLAKRAGIFMADTPVLH